MFETRDTVQVRYDVSQSTNYSSYSTWSSDTVVGIIERIIRITMAGVSEAANHRSTEQDGGTARTLLGTSIEYFFRRGSDGLRTKKKQNNHRSNYIVYKTITASSPFIEVDLQLSAEEMSMLIHGLKYVIPCQSRFSRLSVDELVNRQYESMSSVIKRCLQDNYMSITDDRAKRAFAALKELLQKLYSKPTKKNVLRSARRELHILRHLKIILKQRPDIVIRRTDKCKVFYVGRAEDFTRKTEEYMAKTEAYEEVKTGRSPLADMLQAVQALLNYLFSKKALTKKQCQYLSPKMDQLELAHYHGLPKPHKVR